MKKQVNNTTMKFIAINLLAFAKVKSSAFL